VPSVLAVACLCLDAGYLLNNCVDVGSCFVMRSQALGERCVSLILDSHGYVLDVGPDASDAAFGFPPHELVSMTCTSCLADMLR
jgi:hypothetical protein